MLEAVADASHGVHFDRSIVESIVKGATPESLTARLDKLNQDQQLAALKTLSDTNRWLSDDHEIPAIMRALDARFIRPAPGGDVLHNPAVMPTGRNLHGHDPFRLPSAYAMKDGARQAEKILARHTAGLAKKRSFSLCSTTAKQP